jgi:hypothetical protein
MVLGLAMAAYAFSEMVKLSDGVLSDTVAYPKKYTSLMIGMMYVVTGLLCRNQSIC